MHWEYVEHMLQGTQEGFHIEFNYQEHVCKSPVGTMKSVSGMVEEYGANEKGSSRLLSPLTQKEKEGMQISPLGIIKISHQPGK